MQSLQNAGRQRCSPLQRGRENSDPRQKQLGLSFVQRWKVCVCLSMFVAQIGFHYFVKQQFILDGCAGKTQ